MTHTNCVSCGRKLISYPDYETIDGICIHGCWGRFIDFAVRNHVNMNAVPASYLKTPRHRVLVDKWMEEGCP